MLFLADIMLGKLARWLRLLGYPTIYAGEEKNEREPEKDGECRKAQATDDDELIKQAIASKSILLTRDEALCKKAGNYVRCLLVKSNYFDEQIKEVKKAFKLKTGKDIPQTLCPKCGSKLEKAAKATIKDGVWPRVYKRHRLFWKCTKCGQIYWRGTHVKEIKKLLRTISTIPSSSHSEDDACTARPRQPQNSFQAT